MKRKIRFPLLAKMLIMTLFVSLIPLGMMSFMAYNGINYLTNNIVNVGTITLDDLGKKYIKEKAETVARQLEIYLKAHPEVKPENILNFSELKDIAIQKVGETGFTCLYDVNGIIFLHPQREMTKGFNLRALSKKFPIWWRIIEKSFKEPTGGEYLWKDPDGKIRKKYMYSVPVGDEEFYGVCAELVHFGCSRFGVVVAHLRGGMGVFDCRLVGYLEVFPEPVFHEVCEFLLF